MKAEFMRNSLLAAVSTLALTVGFAPSVIAQHVRVIVQATAPADVAAKGVWDPDTTYGVDDIVLARGSTWRAIKASTGRPPGSTSPNNAKYWQLFARGFNPTGAWSISTQYQPD